VKLDNNNKGCVSDYWGLAIYILKGYLKAKKKKEEFMEIQIFHHAKI